MDIYADGAAAANNIRSEWAYRALIAYARETGQCHEPGWQEDPTEIVAEVAGDLIASIFHVARRLDIDPESLVSSGFGHFNEEVAEEEEETRRLDREPLQVSPVPARTRQSLSWVTRLLGLTRRGWTF